MVIKGLQKLTLLDYPDKLACTVFVGGCNFRCPFCHNASLVLPERFGNDISVSEFFSFLDQRQGRLEGVCVSGGEPTVMPDLEDFIAEIKKRGFSVKLDTNGSRPDMLLGLIDRGLVDYVAMDIKNSPERYEETVSSSDRPAHFNIEDIRKSVEILKRGLIPYEFRTTVMKEKHGREEMSRIGRWLSGAERYFIQNYRPEGDLIEGGFTPFGDEELSELFSEIKAYLPRAEIRRS